MNMIVAIGNLLSDFAVYLLILSHKISKKARILLAFLDIFDSL